MSTDTLARILRSIPIALFLIFIPDCSNQPVMSQVVNTRISLKLLGTYESNNPRSLATTVVNPFVPVTGADATQAEYYNIGGLTADQIDYYLDLAEIRISAKSGSPPPSTSTSIFGISNQTFWEIFANDRTILCSRTTGIGGRLLKNCDKQNGPRQLQQFFGEGSFAANPGVEFDTVDIAKGSYRHLGIYFRRFVTSNARRGASDGSTATLETLETDFDNRTVQGYELTALLQTDPAGSSSRPLLFPLLRSDFDLKVDDDEYPYVLEIRMLIKNTLMQHSFWLNSNEAVSSDDTRITKFIGPADFRSRHDFNGRGGGADSSACSTAPIGAGSTLNACPSNIGRLGGNVIFTARMYKPDFVGHIDVSSAVAGDYIVAVPAGETFSPDTVFRLPLVATHRTSGTQLRNLMPGDYDVYLTCDVENAAGAAGNDGYPETRSASPVPVTVTTGAISVPALVGLTCP